MIVFLVAVLMVLGAVSPVGGETRDPKAVEVAERLMAAMGGKETLAAQRILAFRFAVDVDDEEVSSRLHVWDRHTGQYRLEWETQEGDPLRVLFNVNTREGEVWIGADKVDAGTGAPYLQQAYGRFINDTYWLLMPWKWLDPGVNLFYEGQAETQGVLCDVVRLSFGDVGLTPGDQYWGYVSVFDNRMIQWQYLLQDKEGNPGTGDRTTYLWEDWEQMTGDGLLMSRRKNRVSDGRKVSIHYPMLQCSTEANPEVFHPPPPPASAPPARPSGTPPEQAGVHSVLIVLNKSDHTAAFVNPASGEVLCRVPTGVSPHEGAVSRDGKTLYVANYGGNRPGNTISVIDVPRGEVLRTVDLGENGRPHGILVDTQNAVWVTTEESQSLLRLSPESLDIEQTLVTGEEVTHMVVLSPNGLRAFTANIGSGTISAIDVDEGTVRNITTGNGPEGIDISPDGKEVWVAHRNDNTVVVLDAKSLLTLDTITAGEVPIRVLMSPDGSRVLVSCAASNELLVFDRRQRKEIARIKLDAVPVGVLMTPDGKTAYVANTQANKVSVVDLEALKVTGSIETGREPDGMAWASW